jgi:hypothetical protein
VLPLVDLGEFPSEVSHHVEGYRENEFLRGDMDGVGCGDFSYGASGKAQRPHLQRFSPEYFRKGLRRHKLKMLQCNRVGIGRSHRSSFA